MKSILAILSIVFVLTGCTTNPAIDSPPTEPKTLSWPEHFKTIALIDNWQANAKIAIKVNRESQTATMIWRQEKDLFDLVFSGPFGQSAIKLQGDSQSATLTLPKETPLTGPRTSELLRKRLGWELPVENAKYWILGIPSPLSKNQATLKDERLFKLVQDGWDISYTKYNKIDQHYLPAKIILTRGDVKLLIAVYKWDTELTE